LLIYQCIGKTVGIKFKAFSAGDKLLVITYILALQYILQIIPSTNIILFIAYIQKTYTIHLYALNNTSLDYIK